MLPSELFQTSISRTSYLLCVFRMRFAGSYSQLTEKLAPYTFKLCVMYLYSISESASSSQLVYQTKPYLSGFDSFNAPRGCQEPSCLTLPTRKTANYKLSIGKGSFTIKVHRTKLFGKIEVCDGISGILLARIYYSAKLGIFVSSGGACY